MQYYENTRQFEFTDSVVTLGKFDGIHAGHRCLLKELLASEQKVKIVFSFYVHPSNLLNGEEKKKLIYTNEEKKQILEQSGIDVLIHYPLDRETMEMSAEDFIMEILVKKLGVKKIVVGSDFKFGYHRRGDVALLEQYASSFGYEVKVFEKVRMDDQVVSSSKIRKELQLGKIGKVNRLLTRPYFIGGIIQEGKKLGRTISMPTINIYPDPSKYLPPYGVYATKVTIGGVTYQAITNVGICPTIDHNTKPSVETYIFDYHGNLYGQYVKVEFFHFLRPEQKFGSIEQLKAQMEQDKHQVLHFFKS